MLLKGTVEESEEEELWVLVCTLGKAQCSCYVSLDYMIVTKLHSKTNNF